MENILEVKNICKKFGQGFTALQDVSFSVKRGEFVVIAGSNGSGKTVLMNIIAGLSSPSAGEIYLEKDCGAGLVFQDADSQILGETPYEDVCFGVKNCGLKKEALKNQVEQALKETGLLQKKDYPSRQMSGGEKRRLAVAGILAMQKELIIFDEPFANLDWPGVKQVCSILKKLKEEKKTIILLTHEIEKILALADCFLILDKGSIRFKGKPQDGLKIDLEQYGIRNPLNSYKCLEDMIWL